MTYGYCFRSSHERIVVYYFQNISWKQFLEKLGDAFCLELFENESCVVLLCLNRLCWKPQPKPEQSRVLREKK